MAKGYWVVRVDISDLVTYRNYVAANADPIARHGGRFIIRGGASEIPEGTSRARNVVVEFPSYEAALACYRDPAYVAAKAIRAEASTTDFLVIEGYDGPQPGEGLPKV